MSNHVKYVSPVAPGSAEGLVAQVYVQMKRDFGVIPEPFTLHSPVPNLLAGVWSIARETLVAGHVRRGHKEVVATAVAEINRCPWCVDAHSIACYATRERAAVQFILAGASTESPPLPGDTGLLLQWALSTRSPGASIVTSPPFSPRDAPELVGTAVTFHYLNRMVSALLSPTFMPSSALLRRLMRRTAGWMYANRLARHTRPVPPWTYCPRLRCPMISNGQTENLPCRVPSLGSQQRSIEQDRRVSHLRYVRWRVSTSRRGRDRNRVSADNGP